MASGSSYWLVAGELYTYRKTAKPEGWQSSPRSIKIRKHMKYSSILQPHGPQKQTFCALLWTLIVTVVLSIDYLGGNLFHGLGLVVSTELWSPADYVVFNRRIYTNNKVLHRCHVTGLFRPSSQEPKVSTNLFVSDWGRSPTCSLKAQQINLINPQQSFSFPHLVTSS